MVLRAIFLLTLPLLLWSGERFEVSGDVVKDFKTGLVWQRESSSSSMGKSSAERYCKNLKLSGYSWRLPHIDSLKSIVNYKRKSPATFSEFKIKSEWHWSSTITKYDSSESWIVNFSDGYATRYSPYDSRVVVCVADL
jgi:hypothetical protein